MVSSQQINKTRISVFETMDKETFLYWYPSQYEKWEALKSIRADWMIKYGTLTGIQFSMDNKPIYFLSKVRWAFKFIDQQLSCLKKKKRV